MARWVLPEPAGLGRAELRVPAKQQLSCVCCSAPGNSQFPHHPDWFALTVVFRISSSLLSQKPPAPWQQLWTCKPGGGFYYRIWSWVFSRLMSTMEVKISVLFLGFILCWGSPPSIRGQVLLTPVTPRERERGVTGDQHMGQGMGHALLMGPQWVCLVPAVAL